MAFLQRYLFTGTLVLKTGLHIGSGWTVGSPSNNPVIRTPDGQPFIPGSSFKGAFRSTVEHLAPNTGLNSCRLMAGQGCAGAQGTEQKDFNDRLKSNTWDDAQLLRQLDAVLCDTCKLFGSPYMASHIRFNDLLPAGETETADRMIQVRDGVAIDRDSEKAVDRLKFDYEVVAPAQTFRLEILLEDPGEYDLALTCLGLQEFVNGYAYLGGKRSRGLGNCQLNELTVYELDLKDCTAEERVQRLRQYLLNKDIDAKMTKLSGAKAESFLQRHIESLPALQEAANA